MSTSNLRLIADATTSCFPVVICSACKSINTHHRCLAPVPEGGIRYGNGEGRVCARPICGPFSTKLGHVTVIRCAGHCDIEEDKENVNYDEKPSNKGCGNNKNKQVSKPTNRTAEYSTKELLILS